MSSKHTSLRGKKSHKEMNCNVYESKSRCEGELGCKWQGGNAKGSGCMIDGLKIHELNKRWMNLPPGE